MQEFWRSQPPDAHDPWDHMGVVEDGVEFDEGAQHIDEAAQHMDVYDLDTMCRTSATAKQAAMQKWHTQHKDKLCEMRRVPPGLLQLVARSSQQ